MEPKKRISMTLSEAEYLELCALARREHRTPSNQALYMVLSDLDEKKFQTPIDRCLEPCYIGKNR